MKHRIKVMPCDKARQWILLETIEFKGLRVPSGFCFDGASIPLLLRGFFPHGGRKFFAACLHDWLYRSKDHSGWSRCDADLLFLDAMRENGVPEADAMKMYLGVKVFGGLSWGRKRKPDVIQ